MNISSPRLEDSASNAAVTVNAFELAETASFWYCDESISVRFRLNSPNIAQNYKFVVSVQDQYTLQRQKQNIKKRGTGAFTRQRELRLKLDRASLERVLRECKGHRLD